MNKRLDKVEADVARLQKEITVAHARNARFAAKSKTRLDAVSKSVQTLPKKKK
jgi:hypothetical protein